MRRIDLVTAKKFHRQFSAAPPTLIHSQSNIANVLHSSRRLLLHRLVENIPGGSSVLAGSNSRCVRSVGPLVRPGLTANPVRRPPTPCLTQSRALTHIGRPTPCSGTMAAANKPKVVLLDIEGTVCPISFVKDVLFPYALTALPPTLSQEWSSPTLAPYLAAFPPEHSTTPSALESHVRDLMSRDVKIAYLKSLQGYLWEAGYASGALKAPLFPDVAPRIAEWVAQGVQVMIYSSGSVAAQKLLFRHTNGEAGKEDLTGVIVDYFDTVNAGLKTERGSYERIAGRYPEVPVGSWLFLSDNVREVEAAKAAGMQSVVVERPGNAEVTAEERARHRVVRSFEEL